MTTISASATTEGVTRILKSTINAQRTCPARFIPTTTVATSVCQFQVLPMYSVCSTKINF